jgi:MraZ protein
MPDQVPKVKIYNGCYRHKLDDKRRLPVPFRWRPDASETEMEFTLMIWAKHQAGACIRVLPPDELTKLRAAIDAMPNSDPNKTVLKRNIGTSSAQARLDSAGRITIPDEMAEAADVSNEAVLAGLIDRFEIWNPKRYAQVKVLDNAILTKALDLME